MEHRGQGHQTMHDISESAFRQCESGEGPTTLSAHLQLTVRSLFALIVRVNLKIWAFYYSFMSFHGNYYLPSYYLGRLHLTKCKILYQLHFDQICNHGIVSSVIYSHCFTLTHLQMYLWKGSYKEL